jgi:hypothetical protein
VSRIRPRLDACTLLLFIFLLVIISQPTLAKTDSRGIIRILCIGESYYPETVLPLLLRGDPKVRYDPLPANMGEGTFVWGGPTALKKFVRQYVPRRYEDFLATYDLVILSDYPAIFLEPEHYVWFEKAIREEGAGLAKYEVNFGTGASSYPLEPWVSSAVYAAFPADLPVLGFKTAGPAGAGRPPDGVIVEEGDPLLDLPGVERFQLFGSGSFGVEKPRPSAKTIAWFRYTTYQAIMIWDYGLGRSASTVAGLDWMDGAAAREWDFYPDFFLNQFYWLVHEEIPEDMFLVNNIRRGLLEMQIRSQLILSVVEFVETFGASGRSIELELTQVDDGRAEIQDLYLNQEYVSARERIDELRDLMTLIEAKSVELKDRALFWIYVIEWSVVSGVSLVCGFLLYTLMVRRRMYREVSVTRLSTSL